MNTSNKRGFFKRYTGHECFVDGDKHNFQPRYNKKDLVKLDKDSIGGHYLETVWTLDQEYIGDVCEWCGKVADLSDSRETD